MRLRSIVVVVAVMTTFGTVPPARADIGTHCGGWKTQSHGIAQNACYDRSSNYLVRARGKAYVSGPYEPDQQSIAVSLQRSADGTSWTTVRSAVCGWTDGDIATEAPGNVCLTGSVSADEGLLYRARVFVLVYWRNGVVTQTSPTYSPITT
jgi:hypothetical protein